MKRVYTLRDLRVSHFYTWCYSRTSIIRTLTHVFDKKKTGNLEQCTIGTLWMNFSWLNQIIKRKGPFILCLCFVSGLQLAICSRHFLLTNRSFYRLFRNSYPRCMIKHGLTSNLTCVSKHLKLFEIAALRKLSKMHGRQGKMDGSWIKFSLYLVPEAIFCWFQVSGFVCSGCI